MKADRDTKLKSLVSFHQAVKLIGASERRVRYYIDQHPSWPQIPANGSGSRMSLRLSQVMALKVAMPALRLGLHPDIRAIELVVIDGLSSGVWVTLDGEVTRRQPLARPALWLPTPRNLPA